jgi:hydrogenase nickel incorporation protein HypA/HybF
MHEMSIAMQILEQAIESASANKATRIDEIELEIGQMQQVVFEALELAFQSIAEGTIAEGATLKMSEREITAVCRVCNSEYQPSIRVFTCPRCKSADADIVAGRDIILQSMVCQVEDGVAPE